MVAFQISRPEAYAVANRRAAPRTALRAPCWFNDGATLLTGHIVDISATGARVAAPQVPALGSVIVLRHAVGGPIRAQVVRHGLGECAVAFDISDASVGFMLRVISAHMTNFEPGTDD